MESSLTVIKSFLTHWEQGGQKWHEDRARKVQEICAKQLENAGVLCTTQSRAKSCDSLRRKLLKRINESSEHYIEEKDIRKHICDLSGVRIALYFPSHLKTTEEIINQHFGVRKTKPHTGTQIFGEAAKPERNSRVSTYAPRFSGYRATHYHVYLLDEKQDEDAPFLVEIQVTSMLQHSWSEVTHDILYKQMAGSAERNERVILDGLSGLIQVGELLLDQFYDAYMARLTSQTTKFSTFSELGLFLAQRFPQEAILSHPQSLKILWRFLCLLERDTPQNLTPFIEKLVNSLEERGSLDPENAPCNVLVLLMENMLEDIDQETKNRLEGQTEASLAGQDLYRARILLSSYALGRRLFGNDIMRFSRWEYLRLRALTRRLLERDEEIEEEERAILEFDFDGRSRAGTTDHAIHFVFTISKLGILEMEE